MLQLADDGAAEPSSALDHRTCVHGHRTSLTVATVEGGGVCLACFAALVGDHRALSIHVSYAVAQLSLALASPHFRTTVHSHHRYLLLPALVRSLSVAADDAVAGQVTDVIVDLCRDADGQFDNEVVGDFVVRIADLISGTRDRLEPAADLHGILLDFHHEGNPTTHIHKKAALISKLISGLELPSEEIRGEILFLLYKLASFHAIPWENFNYDVSGLSNTEMKLFRLTLEALLKSEHDDVRMNCIALLMVLVQRESFISSLANELSAHESLEDDEMMQTDEGISHQYLINLLADSIKGPLLSSEIQLQINALDFIYKLLSSDIVFVQLIQVLIKENIADYVFEILRQAENKDVMIIPCLQLLDLFSDEEAFIQRLPIGFSTLLSLLNYVVEIPFHPAQTQVLKLILSFVLNFPGLLSVCQIEDIIKVFSSIFQNGDSDLGLQPETFILACSAFVEILRLPTCNHIVKFASLIQMVARNAVLSSLPTSSGQSVSLMRYSIYLLKEVHIHSRRENSFVTSEYMELQNDVTKISETYLLPWLVSAVDEGEDEDDVLEVLELFQAILLDGSEMNRRKFAQMLASSSWINMSFGYLGLFPSHAMKLRIFTVLSLVVDGIFGVDFGKPIRDCCTCLPSDPLELMFLIGLSSTDDANLLSCQYAILLLLYVGSLYGERIADENQILVSLEQHLLVNGSSLSSGTVDSVMLTLLIHIYGLYRGSADRNRGLYSPEAEKTVFNLINKEWKLLSISIHPTAFKWFFQQEDILAPLSYHLLDFCRFYYNCESQLNSDADIINKVDIKMVAELVVAGDNFVTAVLVSLLTQSEVTEDDMISITTVILGILNLFPDASSDFLCNEISNALSSIYCSSHASADIFISCSFLTFSLLYSAKYRKLSEDRGWFTISIKLIEILIPRLDSPTDVQDVSVIMGIFSLILHHSTKGVLAEASKAILLNATLISSIDSIIRVASSKGPALADDNEETNFGKFLICVLLLYFFSLKSLRANSELIEDWLDFLQKPDEVRSLSVICIRCHDLCRFIHFGSCAIKTIASNCLVELLTVVSTQRNRQPDDSRCSAGYLSSMMVVIEGLLFHEDSIVAANCAICLSIILESEKLWLKEKMVIRISRWFRLIMEELTLTLAAPGLPSESFTNQHKPAASVAVSLLRLEQTPGWMSQVFDSSCISGIIGNLSATNVSVEMVTLFRELLARKFLSEENIARLQQLFQVCRKHLYNSNSGEQFRDKLESGTPVEGEVFHLLVHLMLTSGEQSEEAQSRDKRLLKEIELFFKDSSAQ